MEKTDEPLFVPGEKVGVRGFSEAGYDAECVLVTTVNYVPISHNGYKGWYYNTNHVRPWYAFSEPALVKLPADQVTTWDDCVWRPE